MIARRVFRVFCATLAAMMAAVSLASCEKHTQKSAALTAMDTAMTFTIWDCPNAHDVLAEAKRIVTELENELSVTDENSAVCRANRGERVTLSERGATLCRRSVEMCRFTGGALDVTVYPLVRLWGFTTDKYRIPDEAEIATELERVGYGSVRIEENALSLDDGAMIDLGAVAKGYASDLVADMFEKRGVSSAILNLGGNVRTVGKKPDGAKWRIAVDDPASDGLACIVSIDDGALVTSGSYERFFERDGVRYCHIIDPSTGCPVTGDLGSVTIVGESGFECDALSTAMFVLGYDAAIDFWRANGGFDMILITSDGVSATETIASEVELVGSYADSELTVIKRS